MAHEPLLSQKRVKEASLSAKLADFQQVTNLHPDLHPLLVNLGVILHPLFGVPLIDDMLKVLKF